MAPIMMSMPCLERSMGQAVHWDIYFSVLLLKVILEVKNGLLKSFFPTLSMPGIYN